MNAEPANVCCMIDAVPAALAFATEHRGFTRGSDASPAFAAVVWGRCRCC